VQNYCSSQFEMTCNNTDSTRKFQQWCYYRLTWPDLEGPSWLQSTYSTRIAGLLTTAAQQILILMAVWIWTVSVWKRYIYLLWWVHCDIRLMTFKCTLERSTVYSHWTCTHTTAAAPTAAVSDEAGLSATCDVDKLAQHRWHLAVRWKGKEFYQLQLTTDCD